MWWQLEPGWIFLASHIVNTFYFYSYSQIICEDSLVFMIVPVTKVIQSLLWAHSRHYVTGNYRLSMYKLFVCCNCWGGWLPQAHYIILRLDDFSNCPEGQRRGRTSSEAKQTLKNWAIVLESDFKLIFCPRIHAGSSCFCSSNCKMLCLVLPIPTDCLPRSSAKQSAWQLGKGPPRDKVDRFPFNGEWRSQVKSHQISNHSLRWTSRRQGPTTTLNHGFSHLHLAIQSYISKWSSKPLSLLMHSIFPLLTLPT